MAIPNMWRTKKQRYSLQGGVCPACSSAIFPPRSVCPHCSSPMDAAQSQLRHAMIANTTIATNPALVQSPAGDD